MFKKYFEKFLNYDPEYGTFSTKWTNSRGKTNSYLQKKNLFIDVPFEDKFKRFKISSLVWLFETGEWETHFRFIDGNFINCHISNLLVDDTPKHVKHKSCRVYLNKKTGKWIAWYYENKKVKTLGSYVSKEEAISCAKLVKENPEKLTTILKNNRLKGRTGKLKGVCYRPNNRLVNKYISQFYVNGKTIHLGSYFTEQEAHERYLQEIKSRGL